ncbi:MAG TPA: ABC transporter substrate-binding protein [Acidimicrobiales bacterium]|nr:ABC transporter substrate-binding protein [Acidimicrobiales bacterium]
MRTSGSIPREPGRRHERGGRGPWGLLGGSLLAGVLAAGTGALVAPGPVGAASAPSGTCTPALAPTPAQGASTTGITSSSITVGNVSVVTGPIPGLFEGAPIGVKAYFDMINAEGGVDGRKLLVDSKDDAFSGQLNTTETQEAINSDFALVGSFSLFDGYGCAALASDTAVPDVSVTLDPGTNALPNDFSVQPLSGEESLGPDEYYKKHYPKDMTVGAIVSDVASAKTQMAQQFAGMKSLGYKIAYVDYVSPLQADFTTDVIDMRNAGVNAVSLTGVDWQDAAILMQNAATQNWHPGLIFSGGPVYADQFISHAGGPAVVNGIQIGQVFALYLGQDAKTIPAVKQFLTYVKKVNPQWVPDLYTLYGWGSAELFVQALKAAGPHPTRGAVIAQLKKITSFGANGLIATSDPAAKTLSPCFLMAGIKNGNFVRELPTGRGFDCNATLYNTSALAH